MTDPALMTIPLDDHMAHRGHAVFDTCTLVDGKVSRSTCVSLVCVSIGIFGNVNKAVQ